jgi:hypothetical protein
VNRSVFSLDFYQKKSYKLLIINKLKLIEKSEI